MTFAGGIYTTTKGGTVTVTSGGGFLYSWITYSDAHHKAAADNAPTGEATQLKKKKAPAKKDDAAAEGETAEATDAAAEPAAE